MIIIDFSGVLEANVHTLLKLNDGEFTPHLYKHLVLNTVLSYKKKFQSDYGKLVFALDVKGGYWRHDEFPHYKYKRKEARAYQQKKNENVDFKEVRETMNELVDELHNVFPYKVIQINKCEADDIIGTLVKNVEEKTMIVSRDGDFKQLQKYPWVSQWDPVSKKKIIEKHPKKYLKEHIIRGDRGDGIPNILSSSDVFYEGVRQTALKKKDLVDWMNMDVLDFAETTQMLDRYRENEKLIDLDNVPEDYQEKIMSEYEREPDGSNRNIRTYLIKNRLANLLGDLQFFMEK